MERPQAPITWEVHRRAVPVHVEEFGGAAHLVLCADSETGLVVAFDLVGPDVPIEATAAWVVRQLAKGYPDRFAVVRRDLAEALREQLAQAGYGRLEVVQVRSLPAVRLALRHLGEQMGFDPDEAERYWRDLARLYPDVPGLMADAAQFYRAAPWRHLADTQVLRGSLRLPSGRIVQRFVSVLGGGGLAFGLAVFMTLAGARTAARRGLGRARQVAMLYAVFDDFPEADEPFKERLARRYPVAGPNAYPFFMRQRPGGGRELAPPDLEELRAWLQAVPRFVEERLVGGTHRPAARGRRSGPRAGQADSRLPGEWQCQVQLPSGRFVVGLACDPADWLADDEMADDQQAGGEPPAPKRRRLRRADRAAGGAGAGIEATGPSPPGASGSAAQGSAPPSVQQLSFGFEDDAAASS